MKQNFPRYGICTGKQRILRSSISGYFQQKIMTNFYENSRFWVHFESFLAIFGQTRFFLENLLLSLFSASRFLRLCKISEKTTEKNLHFGYRRKCVPIDGSTGKHGFIGPPCWGTKKRQHSQGCC